MHVRMVISSPHDFLGGPLIWCESTAATTSLARKANMNISANFSTAGRKQQVLTVGAPRQTVIEEGMPQTAQFSLSYAELIYSL